MAVVEEIAKKVSEKVPLIAFAGAAGTIILFAIQLGFYRSQVEINTKRLDVIERHDDITRENEAKLSERISRLEIISIHKITP